jgi:hypothetical protein
VSRKIRNIHDSHAANRRRNRPIAVVAHDARLDRDTPQFLATLILPQIEHHAPRRTKREAGVPSQFIWILWTPMGLPVSSRGTGDPPRLRDTLRHHVGIVHPTCKDHYVDERGRWTLRIVHYAQIECQSRMAGEKFREEGRDAILTDDLREADGQLAGSSRAVHG